MVMGKMWMCGFTTGEIQMPP